MSSSRNSLCPACEKAGKAVKQTTLRSLLVEAARERIEDTDYHFCQSADCETVYFAKRGSSTFTKADLTVRVGIKENEAPRPVCYCFNHTIEEIEDDIRRCGESDVLDDIKTRMREACWCETKSPMGSCCLATVTKQVKAAQERLDPGGDGGTDGAADEVDCCATKSDVAGSDTSDGTNRVGGLAMLGGLLSAIAASACCWLPLLLISLGISGAAVGAVFERYRPILLIVAFALLGVAFYFAYRKQATGDCCDSREAKGAPMRSLNRAMLWVVTAATIAFAFFPNCIGAFAGSGATDKIPPGYQTKEFVIDGMTCEACAVTLEKEIAQMDGVDAVQIDYATGKATVGSSQGRLPLDTAVIETISSAGYRGSMIAESEPTNNLDRNPTTP